MRDKEIAQALENLAQQNKLGGVLAGILNHYRRFGSMTPKQKFFAEGAIRKFGPIVTGEVEGEFNPIPKRLKLPNIKGFGLDLYKFQKRGVSFIEYKNGRCIVGDDMGLGKTPQSLAWLFAHPELRPAIIVATASTKLKWVRDIDNWMEREDVAVPIHGMVKPSPEQLAKWKEVKALAKRNNAIPPPKPEPTTSMVVKALRDQIGRVDDGNLILVINYDLIWNWRYALKALNPEVIIFDEFQKIANNKAKRTKAAKFISKGVEHLIFLSGTPLKNRPIDGYNVLSMIDPVKFNNRMKFGMEFCDGKHDGYGWNFNGVSNPEKLNKILNHYMIRRKKTDVLKQLPQKLKTVLPVEINNRKEYNRALTDFFSWLSENKGEKAVESAGRAACLAQTEVLKQLSVKGKMSAVLSWAEDVIEGGEKLLIFGIHREVTETIHKHFKKIGVKIVGGMSASHKLKAEDSFNFNDKTRVLVANIEAAAEGLNLQHACSNAAFIEFGWTPSLHDQAEDRIYRIGQKASSVHCWYLVGEDTIDIPIIKLIDQKKKVLDKVIDGKETKDMDLLAELFKHFKKAGRRC